MNRESQVCSFELAKRLKEIGVNQISIFCWSETETVPKDIDFRLYYQGVNAGANQLDYSAFTVAELGEMLKKVNRLPFPWLTNDGYKWQIPEEMISNFDAKIYGKAIDFFFSHIEADARAKMLIYLIENKLMEVNLVQN